MKKRKYTYWRVLQQNTGYGWDDIEHFHKHYITPDMLEAGTYLGEYPSRVEGAVRSLRSVRNERSNVVRPNRRGARRSKNP